MKSASCSYFPPILVSWQRQRIWSLVFKAAYELCGKTLAVLYSWTADFHELRQTPCSHLLEEEKKKEVIILKKCYNPHFGSELHLCVLYLRLKLEIDILETCECGVNVSLRGRISDLYVTCVYLSSLCGNHGLYQQGHFLQSEARAQWSSRSCRPGRCRHSPPTPDGHAAERTQSLHTAPCSETSSPLGSTHMHTDQLLMQHSSQETRLQQHYPSQMAVITIIYCF